MGLRPSSQLPRFCMSLTRSKRFSTLRLAPTLLDFLRLACWDMTESVKVLRGPKVGGLKKIASGDLAISTCRKSGIFVVCEHREGETTDDPAAGVPV